MKKYFLAFVAFIVLAVIFVTSLIIRSNSKIIPVWEIRSVDTVKYSRDNAWAKLDEPEYDEVIDKQVADIAGLGVSHIAISTPYDAQFLPYLRRWVQMARKHRLNVWFRGNFSGWEKWFEYESIDRGQHKKLLSEFIISNPDLFEDGDIFTSCPECENGGPGDPRFTGDAEGHRKFLIEEYKISEESFKKINKKVKSGYYSMNYDVAKLIMNRETTAALGGIVSIDHYVKDPAMVAEDARKISIESGGKVVLGEFGAPIPDINGDMNEQQQSRWIEEALNEVKKTDEIIGVNYWVNIGGSTKLWNEDGTRRPAADTVRSFFTTTKRIK